MSKKDIFPAVGVGVVDGPCAKVSNKVFGGMGGEAQVVMFLSKT